MSKYNFFKLFYIQTEIFSKKIDNKQKQIMQLKNYFSASMKISCM